MWHDASTQLAEAARRSPSWAGRALPLALGTAAAFLLLPHNGRGGLGDTGRQAAPAGFAGAEACRDCHEERWREWSSSTHGQAGGPPGPETVVAPFSGEAILFADAAVVPEVSPSGAYVFRVEREGRETQRFTASGVIGRGHMLGGGTQGFVSSFPDGTQRFLPFDYSVTADAWFCNTAPVAGWWVAGGAHPELRPDVGWAPITPATKLTDCGDWPPVRVVGTDRRYANCQQCHGSRIDLAFDAEAARYVTRYATLAIDCESCHGPALRHVEAARAAASGGAAGGDLAIGSLVGLPTEASLEVCFRCHALKRRIAPGYLPGDDLEAHYSLGLPFLGDRPLAPDGKVRAFAYQLNHVDSPCYYAGGMTCVDCHAPHGLTYRDVAGRPLADPFDDGQCLGCHPSKLLDPEAHTFHPPGSEGAACVACHMPYRQHPGVGNRVPYARADHTISIPRPGEDEENGLASACALCHARTPTDTLAARVRAWYGALPPRPHLVSAVAWARRVGVGREAGQIAPEALVVPGERLPLRQVAALNEVVMQYLRPDMSGPAALVPAEDARLVEGLTELARRDPETGLEADVAAVALAALHVGWGDVASVRATLDARSAAAPPGSRLRLRWGRALQQVASTWADLGRREWAVRAATRAQEVLPDDAEVVLDLAVALARVGRVGESLPYYVRSLEIDPTQSYGLVNLGLALEAQGREEAAAAVYGQAIDVFPFEALGHVNLGNVHLRREEFARAEDAYERALAVDPSLALAAYYLAVSRVNQNDLAGARRALTQSLDFAPADPDALELLRRVDEAIR